MIEPDAKAHTPPLAIRAPELLKPPRIPDHELLRRIGRGSYGEVWLARSVTGAYRAVKIVSRQSFDHDRPFEREFSGILKFEPISRKHESQVDILHVGRGEDCFYYVMELADDQVTAQQINPDSYAAKTLKSELFHRGKLPFEECVRISLALTTALDHLHTNGLVHRDVKPSNIIFVNGVPKLADIGLVTGVDATRSFVGTEGFAPPEGPGTPQADIYSLGKVLYEICTGKDRQDFPELPTNLDALTDREPLLELNAVIAKACREDPRQRYPSAKGMHDELLLLQSGKSLARLHTMERTLGKLKRASAAIAMVTVLVTAAWLYQSRQTHKIKKLASENQTLAQQSQASAADSRRNELLARENLYAADISLAQQALAEDNLRQVLDLLRSHVPKPGEPDLRGFEWRYLWRQCQSEELFSLPGHERAVPSVAFSPDGRMLATASLDDTTKIWDLTSRREIATLSGHTNAVWWVSFSPGGNVLATASATSLRLWDATTFLQLRTLPKGMVEAKFSPDGKYLVAGGPEHTLLVYDTRTWEIASTIEIPGLRFGGGYEGAANIGLAFSADSRRVTAVFDEGIKLLGIPDLQQITTLKDSKGRMPFRRFASFSPDGRTLAACTVEEYGVKLWDIETQKETQSISAHSDSVFGAMFSPDGKALATCSPDQTVKLWDVASGALVRTFKGHRAEVATVAFSPDGKLLASASHDGAVKVWDASPSSSQRTEFTDLPTNMGRVKLEDFLLPFGFSLEGNLMAFTSKVEGELINFTGKGRLGAFNAETVHSVTQQSFRNPLSDSSWVLFGNLSGDGRFAGLVIGDRYRGPTNRLDVFDLIRRQFLCSVENAQPWPAFAPKRQLLATVTSNRTVTVWQLPAGSRKIVLTNASGPLAFSPDGAMLATSGARDSEVRFWNIGGDVPHQLSAFHADLGDVTEVEFSPDGRILASVGDETFVKLWAVPTGRPIRVLTGHKRSNMSISFSPDGRTLASMADDRIIRLWHVVTGRELMRLQFSINRSTGGTVLGFSPDGQSLLASRGLANFQRLYYAPSFDEIALAEGALENLIPPKDPISWHVRGRVLAKGERVEEAVQAFSKVVQESAGHRELEALRTSALQHRSQLLKRLGKLTEAGADNCAALDAPTRDPRTPRTCIDLSAYYNGSLESEPINLSVPAEVFLDSLPRGLQTLPGSSGVLFDLRGVIQLKGDGEFPGIPRAVGGIQVRQKCRRLHLLHATGSRESEDADIGAYMLHYADGTRHEIPILYGQHLRDWVLKTDSNEVRIARVAWTGTNSKWGAIRLFERIWENPNPEIEIQTMDFVSKMTKCAPFLIAITAESSSLTDTAASNPGLTSAQQ